MGLRIGRLVAALLVGAALAPGRAAAQDDGEDWALEGEVGTSLYFGASDQTAVLLKGGAEHTSERIVFGGEASFEYGEARVLEGEPYVNKRSWNSGLSVDYTPDGRVNPFVSLTAEGSYERRIDLRLSGGLGARYRFVRGDAGRLDLSLAALVERTDPRDVPDEADEVELLARWSARFRARRSMREGGVVFDLVSFYRPAFQEPAEDFTVEVTSSVTFALTRQVGIKLSLADKYDSLAEDRGARDNNDGRLFFSLSATTR
ncbi:MAG: DUF481 domain-containing protein [Longimicrobiales bacterium]